MRACAFHRKAFTLIELLVVIAIVGVLIGLLLPAVQKVRNAANRMKCANNLKQIGVAMHHYHDSCGTLPPGYTASMPYVDGATDTTPGWGWGAYLLPFIEQQNVYSRIDFNLPVGNSALAIQTTIPIYLCPSDMQQGPFPIPNGFGGAGAVVAPCSYAACVGGDESGTDDASGYGIFYRNSRTQLTEITDGTSNTIMVGDRAWSNANGIWAGAISGAVCKRGRLNPCPGTGASWYPAATLVLAHSHLNNATTDADGGLDDFSSNHAGGSNFLFADGSVRFLRSIDGDLSGGGYSRDSIIFQALGTRANADDSDGLD